MKTIIKTIFSDYNGDTGISTVKIATDCGLFEGKAYLHPEDKEEGLASNYAGCRYAELRAVIKYATRKKSLLTSELNALTRVQNELESTKDYSPKSTAARILQRNIYLVTEDITQCTENIKSLKKRLRDTIQTRENVIEKIVKTKQD